MIEIEKELIYYELGRLMVEYIVNEKINYSALVENRAANILALIKQTISDEAISDFEKVDKIVELLNKYGIETGNCHDF